MADFIKDTESQFKQIITNFEDELKAIHTGRAHAGLVEDLKVNHYNSVMALKQVASISIDGPQTLVIRPWDPGALQPIETAIREAGRSLNPSSDGVAVRVVLPPLSSERRQELFKLVTRQAEAARIGLRNSREEQLRTIKDDEKKGSVTQDDRYRYEKELNELITRYNKNIEDLVDKKQKSIEI